MRGIQVERRDMKEVIVFLAMGEVALLICVMMLAWVVGKTRRAIDNNRKEQFRWNDFRMHWEEKCNTKFAGMIKQLGLKWIDEGGHYEVEKK